MARGAGATVALLALILLGVIVVFTAVTVILGVTVSHPFTTALNILLQTINGNGGLSRSGFLADAIVLVVTVVGVLIFAAFLGSVVTGMEARLQRLRQGRSLVLERDHTLILGWSDRIFVILSELSVANESRHRPSVVILAARPKLEMEEAIREQLPDMRNTRVVCRTGTPVSRRDLELVNHREARSVIVLSADDEEDPDADVIKTLLALKPDGNEDAGHRHVVAEIEDAATADEARLIGHEAIVLIDKHKTVSRLIVQTSRQSGAATVYRELLDFAGSEIYMRQDERLTGHTYLQAALAYLECSVIGVMHGDGAINLNPPGDTVVKADDTIIALAEDDSIFDLAAINATATDHDRIAIKPAPPPTPEATLILGYNKRTPRVIAELADHAPPGSRAMLVTDAAVNLTALPPAAAPGGRFGFEYQQASTTNPSVLAELDIPAYDRVIVMSCSDDLTPKHASIRSLRTLLRLRDIARRSESAFAIVTELVHREDANLAAHAGVSDIVISDEILSLLLTQVAENRHLGPVFDQLFQAHGSEVYLRPVELYVQPGQVTFATLIEAAIRRAETAIGYWPATHDNDSSALTFGILVNPPKTRILAAAPGDRLIVLADS
jgi:Trk K+ transport system NAD-binding subunit